MSSSNKVVIYEVPSASLGVQFFAAKAESPKETLVEIIQDFNSPKNDDQQNLLTLIDVAGAYGFINISGDKVGQYSTQPIKLKVQL